MQAICGFAWYVETAIVLTKVTSTRGEPPGSEHQMSERSENLIRWVWLCKTRGTCEIQHLSWWDPLLPSGHHFKRPWKVGFGSNRRMTDDCWEVSCHWHKTKCLQHWHFVTDTGNANRQDTYETLDQPCWEALKSMLWLKEVRLFQSAPCTWLVPDTGTWRISD